MHMAKFVMAMLNKVIRPLSMPNKVILFMTMLNFPMIFRVNMFIFHINLYFKHFINSMHNILEYFMYYISIKNYCQLIILTFIYLNISIVHFGSIFLSLVIKFLVVAFEEFVLLFND